MVWHLFITPALSAVFFARNWSSNALRSIRLVAMSSLFRILSFAMSSCFRAIWYPFEIVLCSIFKALHCRTCRTSDSEALDASSTSTSKIVSMRCTCPSQWLLTNKGWHDYKCMRSKCFVPCWNCRSASILPSRGFGDHRSRRRVFYRCHRWFHSSKIPVYSW